MNYEPDDPRLTAYALNELDEASNREIEAHLQEDPEARHMVEEIRATSALLSTELKKESAPKLHAGQRAAIQTVARVGERTAPTKRPIPLRSYRPFVAAVAALMLVSVTMFWFTAEQHAPVALQTYGYKNAPDAIRPSERVAYESDQKVDDKLNSKTPLDEAGGTGVGGAALEDLIGAGGPATPRSGGGWGGGVGAGKKSSSIKLGDHFETINEDLSDADGAFAKRDAARRSAPSVNISRDEIDRRMKERTKVVAETSNFASDSLKAESPEVLFSSRKEEYALQKELPAPKSEAALEKNIDELRTTLPAAISAPPSSRPVEPTKEEGYFKNELKEKIPSVATGATFKPEPAAKTPPVVNTPSATTPAKIKPVETPRESVVAVTVPPVSAPDKTKVGGVTLFSGNDKKESKKPRARPLDNPTQLVDDEVAASPTTPAAPLNPLGYAETKKPEPPLRYAPTQYQSYIQPTYTMPQGSEEYARVNDNTFRDTNVLEHRLSTFSADVDTAAYSNVRRFINQGQLPPADAVRIEEMVNYFKYDYAAPKDGKPFHVFMELAQCPWNPNHKLARIGVKAAEIEKNQRPASNLVFLIDVSGSMEAVAKLPLVKKGLAALVENLNENDRVSIVTYASGTTLALPSTPCSQKGAIIQAIRNLNAAGSTNGGDGIQRAYQQAAENFLRGGVNRVILATDGDFNVGITDQAQLTELIEAKAKEGVFLTVLGYGMGNLKDAKLELLANKGNGNYAYIDTDAESRRVLVEQLSGTLVTVAKDVKFQVEFNPSRVRAYRLVGYENRILAHADFNNDAKDAGEIGAGHIVTALYEIVPTRDSVALPGTDPLRYLPAAATAPAQTDELLMLKVRYKLHNQDNSSLLEFPVQDNATSYSRASQDFKFSAAVAGFGMLLRGSPYRGNSTFESVLELGGECVNGMPERKEFIELVQKARDLRR